jgi:hypothetical protein
MRAGARISSQLLQLRLSIPEILEGKPGAVNQARRLVALTTYPSSKR